MDIDLIELYIFHYAIDMCTILVTEMSISLLWVFVLFFYNALFHINCLNPISVWFSVDTCNVKFKSKLKEHALHSICWLAATTRKQIVKPVTLINILVSSLHTVMEKNNANKYRKNDSEKKIKGQKKNLCYSWNIGVYTPIVFVSLYHVLCTLTTT